MSALNLNKEQFDSLRQGEKPVLVDFWAPWCSYCRRIGSAFEKVAEQYGEEMEVGKINIDDHPVLAERYFIEFVPTLVIFSEGDLIDFVISPSSRDEIAQFIEEAL